MISVFDHPWLGGLFADDASAALWSPDAQFAHYIAFEAAYSRALGQVGLTDAAHAEAAALAIGSFKPDEQILRDGTARDGLPIPELIRQLKQSSGNAAEAVHTGATSQDVLDTALALTLKAQTDVLLARLDELAVYLSGLSERFGANALMGRTRMQAALPITVTDRIETWKEPVLTNAIRLRNQRPAVEKVQLGGPVGTCHALGDKAEAVTGMLARDLGLHVSERPWHTDRTAIADYAGTLSLVTGSLGKMGQDMCLMSLQEIGEISFRGGGGSSAMPHKSNPVQAELLVTLARFNAAQISGVHQALVHEQERSGSAWMLEWMILPQMAVAAGRALSAAINLCERIEHLGREDD